MGSRPSQSSLEKNALPPSFLRRLGRLSGRLGLFGWVGCAAALFALWFLVSACLLRNAAGGVAEPGPEAKASVAFARHLGFGERFVGPFLDHEGRGVRELRGNDVKRARAACLANARASLVFGLYLLLLAGVFLGLRFLDPALRRGV